MKACAACGSRNEERSLFCNECGERLTGKDAPSAPGAGSPSPAEATVVADPGTVSMHGNVSLPGEGGKGAPTPVAPARAPTKGGACAACGYVLPASRSVKWCPGCGKGIGEAAQARITNPPLETTSTGPVPEATPVDFQPSRVVPAGWSLAQIKAGERVARFPLDAGEIVLGRLEGSITFPSDALLSPRHARIILRKRSFWLEDSGSRNGVFLRLLEPTELRNGDVLSFGSLVFCYRGASGPPQPVLPPSDASAKPLGSGRERARGHLVRILQDGSDGPAYPLTPSKTIFGRKLGNFLFPDDPLLSRQHLQFYERDGEMVAEDLGSSNGTLLRLRGPVPLDRGTVFRMGEVTLEVVGP